MSLTITSVHAIKSRAYKFKSLLCDSYATRTFPPLSITRTLIMQCFLGAVTRNVACDEKRNYHTT